jgi:two-component system, chemotaxis family, response regulator Rcp1
MASRAVPAGKPATILLVEDNPGDVRLTKEALRESPLGAELWVAEDGVEAMDFLRRVGKHVAAPRPSLVLLDLNLPKKDGLQVLREIKSDPELRRIPVVILSTSRADWDVRASYENQANCFITKPVHLDQFLETVRTIGDFWLSVVELPPA